MNTQPNKPPTDTEQAARVVFRSGVEPASASASASAGTEQRAGTSNQPLRSGDVRPAISAAPHAARGLSADELRALRALPYEKYLLTAHWRVIRNAALKRAAYRCSKCQVGRNLQVHHLTYERLGEELDTDLEVLCRGCHLGLHVYETKTSLGIYLKLIAEALDAENFESVAELSEAVKVRCARAKIPYYDGQIQAALAMLGQQTGLRLGVPMPPKYRELLHTNGPDAPLTHAEACGCIAQLCAQGLMKPMPTVKRITQRHADRRIALRQIAALLVDQVAACEAAEAVVEREKRGLPARGL